MTFVYYLVKSFWLPTSLSHHEQKSILDWKRRGDTVFSGGHKAFTCTIYFGKLNSWASFFTCEYVFLIVRDFVVFHMDNC